jgi:hypothetical protein
MECDNVIDELTDRLVIELKKKQAIDETNLTNADIIEMSQNVGINILDFIDTDIDYNDLYEIFDLMYNMDNKFNILNVMRDCIYIGYQKNGLKYM